MLDKQLHAYHRQAERQQAASSAYTERIARLYGPYIAGLPNAPTPVDYCRDIARGQIFRFIIPYECPYWNHIDGNVDEDWLSGRRPNSIDPRKLFGNAEELQPILFREEERKLLGFRLARGFKPSLLKTALVETPGFDVRDVSTLERQAWYPGEWFSYYETGQLPDKSRKSDPPPVYQLVSQPLDGYRYGNQFKLPYLSRQTDFTVLYMDMNADDWGETMTLHFMSSKKEGFMNWHVESGGALVWYFVYEGQMDFLFLPPTDHDLQQYENGLSSKLDTHRVYLPDVSMETPPRKVSVAQGKCVLLPPALIQCIYFPQDTIAFSGSIVNMHAMNWHLRIVELEERAKTPPEQRYPRFERTAWLALRAYGIALYHGIYNGGIQEALGIYRLSTWLRNRFEGNVLRATSKTARKKGLAQIPIWLRQQADCMLYMIQSCFRLPGDPPLRPPVTIHEVNGELTVKVEGDTDTSRPEMQRGDGGLTVANRTVEGVVSDEAKPVPMSNFEPPVWTRVKLVKKEVKKEETL